MEITIVGTGYVGLTAGVCYAELGHQVICVDNDQTKLDLLIQGISPIYEPGLEPLMKKNMQQGRLSFTSDITSAVRSSTIIILAVGTPSMEDGDINLSYIDAAARQIGQAMKEEKIIVNKSTVPVGSADRVKKIIQEVCPDVPFSVASVPEFLREGCAVHDILNGERIIIGVDNDRAKEILVKLHEPFNSPIQVTDTRSAELIKYAANSFLAMKISFMNEISNLAEHLGADVLEVAKGIGADSRIGNKFLNAGVGFGGSCFPKDTLGMIKMSERAGYDFRILKEVVKVNDVQYLKVIQKLQSIYPVVEGRTISILGLSFKPETDDLREAPSIKIINSLLELSRDNIRINVYDPIAIEPAKKLLGSSVNYCLSIEEAIKNTDACIIVTEWKQIKEFDWNKNKQLMNCPIIIDGRNCLTPEQLDQISYIGMGRFPVSSINGENLNTNKKLSFVR
ncbi:UDP-glucose dehydrogenase family protein [Paenibacillus ihumii]|uniref:UDP-glucose dehydrogenase family protein n=1 Tax=Paenibacillus ihumii TaxID=687436 RepID=UPI0006D86200|nr:UDP-glucose/GDP-mannose dehydrogenase family protein [Paenibacillus ihumii]